MAIGTGARSAPPGKRDVEPTDPGAAPDERRPPVAAWLLPAVLLAVAAVLRFGGLDEPERIYFDETYYVDDARAYLSHGVEEGFAVHPPVGKWLIAAGIRVLGDNPVGWRAAPALAGTLTVLMVYLAGLRLFRRRGVAALAALLLAVDGLAFTMSRIAMLDAFVALFVVTGFWLLLVDRDRQWAGLAAGERSRAPNGPGDPALPHRPHWSRWLAGVVLGVGLATKWSALLAIGSAALFVLASELLWRRRITGGAWVRPWRAAGSAALTLVMVPAAVYVLSHAHWFANLADTRHGERLCPDGACAVSLPGMARVWVDEQVEIAAFHRDLDADHTYRAPAWTWPLLLRPVAYYYESCDEQRQADDDCVVEPGNVAEILGLGNPAVWWLSLGAYPTLAWMALARRDWAAAAVLVFLLGQYLPWLLPGRPVFLFYMAPLVPFLALGLAHASAGCARHPLLRWMPGFVAVIAVAAFLFWYPLYAGLEIPRSQWDLRIWMRSWI